MGSVTTCRVSSLCELLRLATTEEERAVAATTWWKPVAPRRLSLLAQRRPWPPPLCAAGSLDPLPLLTSRALRGVSHDF